MKKANIMIEYCHDGSLDCPFCRIDRHSNTVWCGFTEQFNTKICSIVPDTAIESARDAINAKGRFRLARSKRKTIGLVVGKAQGTEDYIIALK